MQTEKEKFFGNLKNERDQGLKGIDFFTGDMNGATEEEFYAELNRMDAAPVEVDLELFPETADDEKLNF